MTEIPEHPLEPVSGLESKIDSLVGDISVIKAGGGANVQQMREELERKLGEAEKKVVRSTHCYQYHLKRALFFMNRMYSPMLSDKLAFFSSRSIKLVKLEILRSGSLRS